MPSLTSISAAGAARCAQQLVEFHVHESSEPLTDRQRAGYREVGKQFGKFLVQAYGFRNVQRSRQILFANVPALCAKYGLDRDNVFAIFEVTCMGESELLGFYREVCEAERLAIEPMRSSLSGCIVPVAFIVAVPMAAVAIRLLA
jgi:hypothetical protein